MRNARLAVVASVWQVVYGVVHVWWAVDAPQGLARESYFPGGWLPVGIAVVAFAGCGSVAVGAARGLRPAGRYAVAGLNALAGIALCAYSFLFPVMLASILFEDVTADTVTRLLASGSGAVGGVLCLALAARERRAAARACASCGRVHGRSPEHRDERSPAWAYAGAYLAVAGYLARMAVWLDAAIADTWPSAASRANGISVPAMVVFLGLMGLAGTLLPLALAHHWGRVWPAWLGPLAGRPVPRWLVLGPGLFMGGSLAAYFGVAGMSAWARGDIDGPFLTLLLELGGYTLWGIGLLVASASYFTLTKPPCPQHAVGGNGHQRRNSSRSLA
ncbi:hypothetical protein [Asanoa siamensis]|uniref:DUF3995 domain-containing protein n=1 Tax=Asanoa siamensis TaxID=926357 RepID=A0ABQ4CZJ3_9ACTN|nr:hypothetical protein [Asanoa siamensis]GIF76418.1 hypothetical protein Asi02nite_59360 [Asanoa siamensis]